MMLTTNLSAGVIRNTNPTTGAPLGSCGPTQADKQACVGAMDLANVETTIYKADGTVLGTMAANGDYPAMGVADYFVSLVKSGASIVAKLGGKVWPVGEPMAVKAVVGDMETKEGKPNNCIINTAYLSADKNPTGLSGFLDQTNPVPVICSSDFQSHKRFKIPMQPASLDSVNTPIDLVFNVVDESAAGNPTGLPSLPVGALDTVVNPNKLRYYQVFSKINNYTGQRLAGYKVIVGTGTGSGFLASSQNNLASKLHLSIGIGEGWTSGATPMPNGSNLTDEDGGATFSHGLFGPKDLPTATKQRWPENGFFDARIAGFNITQECANTGLNACPTYDNPLFNNTDPTNAGNTLTAFDTVKSTTTLTSNYVGPVLPATGAVGLPFGDWLPFGWHPKGIFFDTDNDATTDADLVAWWNGTQWLKNYDSGFAPATAAELASWGSNKSCGTASALRSCYAIDDIEDTVNLGINYTIKVGDGIPGGKVTVRIIPIAATDQTPPVWVGTTPAALPTTTSGGGGGGGGCTTANGDAPFDPILPLIAAAGLAGWGLRRARRS